MSDEFLLALDESGSDAAKSSGFEVEHGCAIFFDLFHTCSSVKGRFRDYYRFGRVRTCMPYWNDFFLCLRLKLETDSDIAKEKWMQRRIASLRERFSHDGNDTGNANNDSPTINLCSWSEDALILAAAQATCPSFCLCHFMAQAELYTETGEPIFGPEADDIETKLWAAIAAIKGDAHSTTTDANAASSVFSMDEFLKRLVLTRAEIDVCASLIELLLGGKDPSGNDSIHLRALPHKSTMGTDTKASAAAITETTNSLAHLKLSRVELLAQQLRSHAQVVRKEREREHQMAVERLLPLHQKHLWHLLPVPRWTPLFNDPARFVPLMAVDLSPQRLFRRMTLSEGTGHKFACPNYRQEPIQSDAFALILRDRTSGSLTLRVQCPERRLLRVAVGPGDFYLRQPRSNPASLDWNDELSLAQDILIGHALFGMLAVEAEEDVIEASGGRAFTILAGNCKVEVSLVDPDGLMDTASVAGDESNRKLAHRIASQLEENYFSSNGIALDWPRVKTETLSAL